MQQLDYRAIDVALQYYIHIVPTVSWGDGGQVSTFTSTVVARDAECCSSIAVTFGPMIGSALNNSVLHQKTKDTEKLPQP